jgi:hypothetical protein
MVQAEDRSSVEQAEEAERGDGDLSDLLEELRILLPGTTTLTAFLIILPFNSDFAEVREGQKIVYLITFLCSVLTLILLTAPAAHHRLQRPLRDREGFKNTATKMMILGLIPLSVTVTLAAELVVAATVSTEWVPWLIAGIVGTLILALWWLMPRLTKYDAK